MGLYYYNTHVYLLKTNTRIDMFLELKMSELLVLFQYACVFVENIPQRKK